MGVWVSRFLRSRHIDPDSPITDIVISKSGIGTLSRRTDKRYYDFTYADTLPTEDRAKQTHSVTFSLTDGELTTTQTITITVNAYTAPVDEPPVIVAGHVHQTIDAGGTASAVIQVNDPDTAIGSVTLTKTGVGTITRRTDKRFYDFTYTDTLPDADRAQQVHTIHLSLTDGNSTVTSSFTITVRAYTAPPPPAVNVPPRLNNIAVVTLDRGQSLDVPITYIDPDSRQSSIVITRTGDGSIIKIPITRSNPNTIKWFWRISSVLDTETEYAAETKTATISITDGEDSGTPITATANIRAYSPPSYYPNLTLAYQSQHPRRISLSISITKSTHDGRLIPVTDLTISAAINGTPITPIFSQGQIVFRVPTWPYNPGWVIGTIFTTTISYTDTRYTTRNTTTITTSYTMT